VAQSIVDIVQQMGGVLTLEDLRTHTSTFDVPLSVNYRFISFLFDNLFQVFMTHSLLLSDAFSF
jgi:gamma-glutamyltranspeptidase